MPDKFDQIHFFIDESGKLQKRFPRKRDILLVGGVVLFGTYSDEDDRAVIKMIDQAIRPEGVTFPEGLHFYDSALGVEQWERVFAALQAEISKWQGEAKSMYGILLSHSVDLFAEGVTRRCNSKRVSIQLLVITLTRCRRRSRAGCHWST